MSLLGRDLYAPCDKVHVKFFTAFPKIEDPAPTAIEAKLCIVCVRYKLRARFAVNGNDVALQILLEPVRVIRAFRIIEVYNEVIAPFLCDNERIGKMVDMVYPVYRLERTNTLVVILKRFGLSSVIIIPYFFDIIKCIIYVSYRKIVCIVDFYKFAVAEKSILPYPPI